MISLVLKCLSAVGANVYCLNHEETKTLLCLSASCHDKLKVGCREYDLYVKKTNCHKCYTIPRLLRGVGEASAQWPRTRMDAAVVQGE